MTAAPTTTKPPTTTAAPTTTMPPGMHMACPGIPDLTPIGAVPPALPMLCDHFPRGPVDFLKRREQLARRLRARRVDDRDGPRLQAVRGVVAGSQRQHRHVPPQQPLDGRRVGTRQGRRRLHDAAGPLVPVRQRQARRRDGRRRGHRGVRGVRLAGSHRATSSSAGDKLRTHPGKSTGDDLYVYGRFGGDDTVGIRLTARGQSRRTTTQ